MTDNTTPESARKKITVMIVDDHQVVRMGLRAMIEDDPDMQVVAEAGDGPAALAAYEQHRPDITLMDLRLPGMSGPEIIAELIKRSPTANVIVITTYDADEDVYRAVQAGARGYLLKGTFAEGMIEAIRSVHAGRRLIAPEAAARLAERVSYPELSAREIGVLEMVAKGLSNREIGTALTLAEDTVKTHLKRIFVKLGVSDRTEAVLLAVHRGILVVK